MSGALILAVLAGVLLGALLVYALFLSLRKNAEAEATARREEMKGQFAALSAETLRAATEQLLALAKSRLEGERAEARAELDERRRAVETTVGRLQESLKSYEELVRAFEADRTLKYGSLEEQLRRVGQGTEELHATTRRLRETLSNSRVRGQWGERMAEDILRAAGLVENVQYLRNRSQETSATRPDFSFLLPQGHKLHMDVKFPMDNYLRMLDAQGEEERARLKAEFLRDVKARIREVQKRDYINPDERTLNYLILFIPNEQIYGFVMESLPELLDEALSQKVVLASPFSLYAQLAVIRQAFDNFHFSRSAEEVLRLLDSFQQAYDKFKDRFLRLGEQLQKASQAYGEVSETSFKRVESALARVRKARAGEATEPVSVNPE